jgi:hypothetical protein
MFSNREIVDVVILDKNAGMGLVKDTLLMNHSAKIIVHSRKSRYRKKMKGLERNCFFQTP